MKRLLRAALAAAFVISARPVFAQGQTPDPPEPEVPRFVLFPVFDFHMSAAVLTSADPRYTWDANFGGEIDIVDYGVGRANFTTNYNVGMGSQLRNFDPNQGNYILELSASRRVRSGELHARFHHTSRHLSDRFKEEPIDWNAVGVFATGEHLFGGVRLHEGLSVERVVKRSYVDYTWLWGGELTARFTSVAKMTPLGMFSPITTGRAVVRQTDRAVAHRGAQTGFYTEAGARFEGRRGAMEFFGGVERRIDASPLERKPETWALFGFRLLNKQ